MLDGRVRGLEEFIAEHVSSPLQHCYKNILRQGRNFVEGYLIKRQDPSRKEPSRKEPSRKEPSRKVPNRKEPCRNVPGRTSRKMPGRHVKMFKNLLPSFNNGYSRGKDGRKTQGGIVGAELGGASPVRRRRWAV